MARPIKNSCEYFPHDADMRNHRKIKSLRVKFGSVGYAIWNMLLESLTGNDGNVIQYSESEFELLSGDFCESPELIKEIIDYCIKLELLFNNENFISSESLDERLAPVYAKRNKSKEQSKKQKRENGKFINAETTTVQTIESVTETPLVTELPTEETPQSKVNEIKVNKSKSKETIDWDVFLNWFNTTTKKNFKVITAKVKTALNARLSDGYTKLDICKAVENCAKDPFHIENPKYLTPEFISRPDKLEKYLNASPKVITLPSNWWDIELTAEQWALLPEQSRKNKEMNDLRKKIGG